MTDKNINYGLFGRMLGGCLPLKKSKPETPAQINYQKFVDEACKNAEKPSIEENMITMTAVCPDGSITITRIAPEDFYKMKKND